MYTVYILLCRDHSLYTGITTDLERRFTQHQEGSASRYTRSRGVIKVVYSETSADRSTALQREAEIKRMTREEKQKLIDSQ